MLLLWRNFIGFRITRKKPLKEILRVFCFYQNSFYLCIQANNIMPINKNYIRKNFNFQNIPISLRDRAVEENWINTLAYWIMLKNQFEHQVIYNATLKKIALLLGISQSTASVHLSLMHRERLITYVGDNINLMGINHLLKREKFENGYDYIKKRKQKIHLLKIKVSDNKSAQVSLLRFTYQRRSVIYQQKAINKKSKVITEAKTNRLTKSSHRYIEKCGGLKKLESSFINTPMVSNKSFGEMINRSLFTARRITKKLKKMGLIDVQPNIVPVLSDNKPIIFTDCKYFRKIYPDRKYRIINQSVCVQLPNAIRLL